MAEKENDKESQVRYSARKELYDFLKDKDYGYFVSYTDLRKILDRDPQGEGRTDILYVRDRWLISNNDRWLECKVGEGYFITHPREHVSVVSKFNEQNRKRDRRSIQILAHTPMEMLSEGEIKIHREEQGKLAMKYLIGLRVDKTVTTKELETVAIPSGKELQEIYRAKKKYDNAE